MGAPGLNHEEKLKLGTKWKSEFLKRGQECLLVMEHPSCRDAGVFGDTMLWRYHGMTAEDNGSHRVEPFWTQEKIHGGCKGQGWKNDLITMEEPRR